MYRLREEYSRPEGLERQRWLLTIWAGMDAPRRARGRDRLRIDGDGSMWEVH